MIKNKAELRRKIKEREEEKKEKEQFSSFLQDRVNHLVTLKPRDIGRSYVDISIKEKEEAEENYYRQEKWKEQDWKPDHKK